MRTHLYNKMLASEIEEYLQRGGNTLFIALGVTEVHGNLPIDCETIMPEAFALELAEQYDGLAVTGIPFLFPGATIISNATVQITVEESIHYLKILLRSFVKQGFKKFIFVTGHGPSVLYTDAVCRDIFEECKVQCIHLMSAELLHKFGPAAEGGDFHAVFKSMNTAMYGSYKKLHQESYLPIDPDFVETPRDFSKIPMTPRRKLEQTLAPFGSRTGMYFSSPEDHGGGIKFRSEEEREAACLEGLQIIHDIVAKTNFGEVLEAMEETIPYMQEIIDKYPRIQ